MRIGTSCNKEKRTDEEVKAGKGSSSNGNESLFAREAVVRLVVVVVAAIPAVAVTACGLFVGGVEATVHHGGCENHLYAGYDAGAAEDEDPYSDVGAWVDAGLEFASELREVLCCDPD